MEQDVDGIEFRKMLELVDFRGKSVIEIGCGDGRVSNVLAPIACSLVAIDPDPARVAKAKAQTERVDFRTGKGENLDFPDGALDVAAFTFSLHHQDAARALSEAKRVLKMGGRVFIVEPAIAGDMHRLFSVFNEEDGQIESAVSAIHECGLRLDEAVTFDILYTFEDAEEVHEYFFGQYGMDRDEGLVKRMDAVLGEMAGAKPIRLLETVNMFALTKI